MRKRSSWMWVGRFIAGAVIVALSVYLYRQGLDRADKIGSSVAVVLALAALAAPHLFPAQPATEEDQMPADDPLPQSVKNASIGGSLTQADEIGGELKVTGSSTAAPPTDDPPSASGAELVRGQSVDGVRVGGHVTQARSVDGDVTVQ